MSALGASLTGIFGWHRYEANTVCFALVLEPPKGLALHPGRENLASRFI